MAEKVREAAARGETARLARLLGDGVKPLPDEVSWLPPPLYYLRAMKIKRRTITFNSTQYVSKTLTKDMIANSSSANLA